MARNIGYNYKHWLVTINGRKLLSSQQCPDDAVFSALRRYCPDWDTELEITAKIVLRDKDMSFAEFQRQMEKPHKRDRITLIKNNMGYKT